jgi:type II secretory pathway pseudopilin PulG
MVTVAIVGFLAAVAIPTYMSYLYKSRTSEAVGMLADIKARQEAYRAEFFEYCDASNADAANTWPAGNPSGGTRIWDDPDIANDVPPEWVQLGASPPKNDVYFSYMSATDDLGTTPADYTGLGDDLGFDGRDFWFVSRAIGDLDSDGTRITFESMSHRQSLWVGDKDGAVIPQGWE